MFYYRGSENCIIYRQKIYRSIQLFLQTKVTHLIVYIYIFLLFVIYFNKWIKYISLAVLFFPDNIKITKCWFSIPTRNIEARCSWSRTKIKIIQSLSQTESMYHIKSQTPFRLNFNKNILRTMQNQLVNKVSLVLLIITMKRS